MTAAKDLVRQNRRYAKLRWGSLLGTIAMRALSNFTEQFRFSIANGDLLFLGNGWYVTHSGLTSLARRNRCALKFNRFSLFVILRHNDGHSRQ